MRIAEVHIYQHDLPVAGEPYRYSPAGVTESETRAKNCALIPQGRLATPAEVARAVIFLATEPHITGVMLPVDGGYTAQ